ncbi:dihydroorotate dehydrogenase electron transfer subunit [candidate division WOR-3 bacterium]|nr:dihydroorotate dehydrogenase electron transfer subunit [candidate division WOR-3 bacterium]
MKVIKNEKIAPGVFVLTIQDKEIATTAKPGQFVNIRVVDSYFPLLRRPLSVYCVEGESFKILYKVVGEGTRILSSYKANEELDIIGPLGNCFNVGDYKDFLLIAGGIGVAPIHFLATSLSKRGSITTLIGAKTRSEILCESEFKELGQVVVSTEDGSYGTRGVVTDLLVEAEPRIERDKPKSRAIGKTVGEPEIIFACGPVGMLKTVKSYARSHFIPCQFSLEQHMACGIGVCLGCAVPVKNGYKYVCKDGPVFWADEIEI